MGKKSTLPSATGHSGLQIFTNGAMTATNSIIGPDPTVFPFGFAIYNFDNVGIQLAWIGTPVGAFTVECSVNGTTWDALTFNPALTQPAGGSGGGYLIDLNQVPFPYIRLHYVNTSGTGVLNAWVAGKDLN